MSKSSDSILSEHCPNFLEVVGVFTGMYFRVHFHSFYALSVINCGCFSQPIRSLLVAGGFQTLDFSMPFVFSIVLILTYSFLLAPKLLAFLSKSAPFSSSCLVSVIIECKTQNAKAMDITDTTHSLLLISKQLIQQDTADHLERPVRQLFQLAFLLTSARRMKH